MLSVDIAVDGLATYRLLGRNRAGDDWHPLTGQQSTPATRTVPAIPYIALEVIGGYGTVLAKVGVA